MGLSFGSPFFMEKNVANIFECVVMFNKLLDIEYEIILGKKGKEENKYFCRSFFPDNEKDYSKNQISWTLLFKKKIFKSQKTEIELFRHKNFKK